MFIQTEDTPNPNTMKFLPSRAVVPAPIEFEKIEDATDSPLALALFAVTGVARVFLGTDFISVTRESDHEWPELRPSILAAIMEHFMSDRPVMSEEAEESVGTCGSACSCSSAPTCAPEDNCGQEDVVKQICELLDTRIRPAVAQDGGDVAFERYEDGIVYLRLKGACAGCPSATATLKFGIENMLKHFIPEIKEVRRVE